MTEPIPPAPTAAGPLDKEPVAVFLAALTGILDAGVVLAASLNWLPLTEEQTGAVVVFVTAVTAIVAGLIRSKVWAPATVARLGGGY